MSKVKLPLEMFQSWVRQQPNRVYLHQPVNRQLVPFLWHQVDDQTRRMAQYIVDQGYPKGSQIAIMSKNCAHWIMADLAIWMAGHVSVPLYPNLTAQTIEQILNHSDSKMLFVGKLDGFDQMCSGIPQSVHCVQFPHRLYKTTESYQCWDAIVKDTGPLKDIPERQADELATIIYTSGTTGMPKGVMHNFGAIAFAGHNSTKDVGIGHDDRFLSYLPLSHVAERLLVETGSLYTGCTVYFAESLDTFKDDLAVARPTIFLAVPRIWNKFRDGILQKLPQKKLDVLLKVPLINNLIRKKIKKGLGLQDCWLFITGAAPIPATLMRWFDSLGIQIQEAYGMSENFAYSHYVRKSNWQPGAVGQPFPGVTCRLAKDGEIQVASTATMMGYFKEPEKTQEMLTDDHFIKTGDEGHIAGDGTLKITGRVKDLFKTSKAKYVAPAPIELKLQVSEYVANVCVVGSGLPQPLALVMLSDIGKQQSEQQLNPHFAKLMADVNGTLEHHERLDRIVVVDEDWTVENGILTPSMKVKRNVVEKRYLDRVAQLTARDEIVWEKSALKVS